MTFVEKYNAEVKRVLPHFYANLMAGPDIKNKSDIADKVYKRGEFVGGMAYAIVRMVEANDALGEKSE